MKRVEVLIVGGGPAGAACAWRLRQNQADCLILDQKQFPRLKPCAGWITPQVVRSLQLVISEYPYGWTTFKEFLISIKGFSFRLPALQYAIRRIEFDDWLVKRSGAPILQHTVKEIKPVEDGYEVDGEYFGKYLVGAGGTYCPVYRTLFKPTFPKEKSRLIVAQEDEFYYPETDGHCRLWFFNNNLPGYAWIVPKANQIINVGVGGSAETLNRHGDHLKRHWDILTGRLEQLGLIRGYEYHPVAHSYYVRQELPKIRLGNAFLAGDALGLATRDMGEGIGNSIQSGLRAADAILLGGEYRLDGIPKYSVFSIVRSGWKRSQVKID